MATPTSDFNLKTITTSQFGKHLDATIKFGGNMIVFARRGTGKTVITKEAIRRAGMKEIYLNVSTVERVDFGGYPDLMNREAVHKYIKFILPEYYEALIEGDTPCVVLLDEVDKADPSVWAPLLELTQFRSINGRLLKNLHAVIMTGNMQAEGGQRPHHPLLDRAEKFIIEANVSEWLNWAGDSKEIHPSVLAYIKDKPEDLFGEIDPGDLYADPSPRGWTLASKFLFFAEENNMSSEIMTEKVAGYVGKKAGIEYLTYFKYYQELLPMIDKVFEGNPVIPGFTDLHPGKQIVSCMIVASRFARILDETKPNMSKKEEKDFKRIMSHVGKFFLNADHEMSLMAIRSQVGIQRTIAHNLDEDDNWNNLLESISNVVNSK